MISLTSYPLNNHKQKREVKRYFEITRVGVFLTNQPKKAGRTFAPLNMLNVDDTEVDTLINTFKIKDSSLKYYPYSTTETKDHDLNNKNIYLISCTSWLS